MSPRITNRRGTILIVTIFIVFTLASLVLVMSRSTRVESLASANLVAAVQASAVERGAEQYVLSILTEQKDTLTDLTEEDFAAITNAFRESILEMQEAEFLPRHREVAAFDPNHPPVPGARLGKDPDGQPAWFVPNPDAPGKYLRVTA